MGKQFDFNNITNVKLGTISPKTQVFTLFIQSYKNVINIDAKQLINITL